MSFARRALFVALVPMVAACVVVPNEDPTGTTEQALSTGLVIRQVYGGGGNSGALYASDYVEIFNRGTTSVSLSGLSLQYAAATGTTWSVIATLPAKSVPAGGHFLVTFYTGTTGAAISGADLTGTQNLAAGSGRVALANKTTALTCTTCATSTNVVDLVGYGAALDFEGSGPAPLGTAITAVTRNSGGCAETDDNAADFAASPPNPASSTSAATPCGGDGGVADTGTAVDTGSSSTDTGASSDTGSSSTDTGSSKDTGSSSTDTGAPSTDTGSSSTDTGSGATDDTGGPAPDDAGATGKTDAGAVVDTGTSSADTGASTGGRLTGGGDLPEAKPACACSTPGSGTSSRSASMLLALFAALPFVRRRRSRSR